MTGKSAEPRAAERKEKKRRQAISPPAGGIARSSGNEGEATSSAKEVSGAGASAGPYGADWLFRASRGLKGLSSVGLLALLAKAVPEGGGLLRAAEFAESAGIDASNVRKGIGRLAKLGLVECENAGEGRRKIRILCRDGESRGEDARLPAAGAKKKKAKTTGSGGIAPKGGTSEFVKAAKHAFVLERVFAAALAAGRKPELLESRIVGLLLDFARRTAPPSAMGVLLRCIPLAKSDPNILIEGAVAEGEAPDGALSARIAEIDAALCSLRSEIGDEILSKDWCKAAEVLGIAAKPEDAKEVQKATLSRLDAFVAEHLAPAPKGIV